MKKARKRSVAELESRTRADGTNHAMVSIAGGGPAGLVAGLTVARHGGRAVVFERNAEVGKRFHGDFQGLENWTAEGDVLDELAGIGVEPSFDAAPYREGVIFGPDGREYGCRSPRPLFYLVRRGPEPGTLDSALRDQALRAGVEIRFGEPRDHLPEGGIVAHGPRGADVIAVGYVFETDMADGCFGAFSDRLAPGGYSYLLVHRGRGAVAACLFGRFHEEKEFRDRTVAFFHEKAGLRMTTSRPFGGEGNFTLPSTARQGKLLFTGEAAGFQDALWGFGMRYAMASGHMAALALLDGNPERYDALWQARLGGLIRSSLVNRYLFDKAPDSAYGLVLRRLGRDTDAREWLCRLYMPRVWKSLSYPIAQRAIRSRRRAATCAKEGCDCTWCRCRHEPPAHH